ncbi:NADH-quinone oxidoreductase subunit N [Spirilliplanes yamanashiensis]|uniref:NADH-quinone oxidoreductase subunit N n=1 Tax=Spirilliplanes yamanashiensis TaxID=42233 RepID=A0A8J3Y9R1_9ACTN|nr:proton-conducting transporter membrane subunit [Spirilliplanes yamanashiensis]MDP9815815.1 NADH-quinone oxidoreductase subunit N [Spirilliplanes yamanashiensis]GIJ04070.1 NADH-quinone oxidoreductase subunit N [Spirilliplanes yamanashiensis]
MSQTIDHVALLPGYLAALTAVLVLVADLFLPRLVLSAAVAGAVSVAAAAVAVVAVSPALADADTRVRATFCNGAPGTDCSWESRPTAALVAVLFAILTVAVLALSAPMLRRGDAPAGEFCFLLTCAMTGGVVTAYAGDLVTLIVGLETLTLPLYILVGLRRPGSPAGARSAVTFLLVSIVSTAIALLGAALLYAATGTVFLRALAAPPLVPELLTVGAVLLAAGLAFKVAAVPLHAWAPATYDGAPLPVAAYLSTASKLGGVAALVAVALRLPEARWTLLALGIATMTVGNLVALRQDRMVRLLAWSSIAQAGFVIVAPWQASMLGYATFFVLLEIVAFAAVVALRPAGASGGPLSAYRGAARRHPWIGAALVLALTGLAGLPPGLAGLFAKVTVVQHLVDEDLVWVAVIVAANAVVALAYYVRVIALLYATPETADTPETAVAAPSDAASGLPAVPRVVVAALVVVTAVAVVAGFVPQLVFDAVNPWR